MARYGLPTMFEAVFKALNDRDVRYLVAGGVAVVLHGHPRLTKDLDLVVDLAEAQALAAIEALTGMGLKSRVPVDPRLFADQPTREAWQRDRGMTVFTMLDPDNPMLVVDLFTQSPSDFEGLWARAKEVPLDTTSVKIVSLDDLIAMKRAVGRPRDLLDITELERIRELQDGE